MLEGCSHKKSYAVSSYNVIDYGTDIFNGDFALEGFGIMLYAAFEPMLDGVIDTNKLK